MIEGATDTNPSAARRAGKRAELRTLTSLRFLAALAVFLDHSAGALWPYLTGSSWRWLLNNAEAGGSGVTFFFILSGFILTYNYQDRLADSGQRLRFWVARFGRVYPVHILTFCVAVGTFAYYSMQAGWSRGSLFGAGVANVLLLQAWIPFHGTRYVTAYDGPSWTLSCEMFFYALLPFILLLVAPLRRRGTKALFAVGLLVWLVTLALLVTLHGNPSAWVAWLVTINPAMRLAEFLIGVLAGTVFLARRDRGLAGGFSTRTEIVSLLLLLGVTPLCLHLVGHIGLNVVFVPFMLLVIWVFAHEGGRVSRLLSRPRFVFLGEISFSFYMIHFLLIEWIIWPTQSRWPMSASLMATLLALVLALTLVSSSLLFRCFETPARRLVRQYGERWISARGVEREPVEAEVATAPVLEPQG